MVCAVLENPRGEKSADWFQLNSVIPRSTNKEHQVTGDGATFHDTFDGGYSSVVPGGAHRTLSYIGRVY